MTNAATPPSLVAVETEPSGSTRGRPVISTGDNAVLALRPPFKAPK